MSNKGNSGERSTVPPPLPEVAMMDLSHAAVLVEEQMAARARQSEVEVLIAELRLLSQR